MALNNTSRGLPSPARRSSSVNLEETWWPAAHLDQKRSPTSPQTPRADAPAHSLKLPSTIHQCELENAPSPRRQSQSFRPSSEQAAAMVGFSSDEIARQLREFIAQMTSLMDQVDAKMVTIDDVYEQYAAISFRCATLSKALVSAAPSKRKPATTSHVRANSSISSVFSSWAEAEARSSGIDPEGRRTSDILTRRSTVPVSCDPNHGDTSSQAATTRKQNSGPGIDAIREWKTCLERMVAAHKQALAETYKRHDHFVTPTTLNQLFAIQPADARSSFYQKTKDDLGVRKRMSSQPDVWAKWELQFGNYEQLAHDLSDATVLLLNSESGISLGQAIRESVIAPRGDAVLEFANSKAKGAPVWRFRVSSYMLAETSPIFSRIFNGSVGDFGVDEDEIAADLPLTSSPFIRTDGSHVTLYRMPQIELNDENAMSILLHAAHMHNDKVPREVSYEQFVAIADVCLRYKCTSPLELLVEHRWLPQWVHKTTEDMPEGLVLISYAFGLRGFFTRVTKTMILNLVDEEELQTKNLPQKVKDKIWAIRCAKMEQVYTICSDTISEYMWGSRAAPGPESLSSTAAASVSSSYFSPRTASQSTNSSVSNLNASLFSPATTSSSTFSRASHCPKGSHLCDATNLGWLMLVYNELQLLPTIMGANSLPYHGGNQLPQLPAPSRSLAQTVDALRSMASPPQQVHPARSTVCDPAPAFRSVINDVYNSVTGLTLYEIDGRRHGWALSRDSENEPQAVLRYGEGTLVADPWEMEIGDKILGALGVPGSWPEGRHDGDQEGADSRLSTSAIRSVANDALQDEEICQRILHSLEDIDDIQSLAMVNRTFYAAYKMNELELMKSILRLSRKNTIVKRTASSATATVTETQVTSEDKVLKHESDRTLTIDTRSTLSTATIVATAQEEDDSASFSSSSDSDAMFRSDASTSDTASSQTLDTPLSPDRPYSSFVQTQRLATACKAFSMTEEEAMKILCPDPEPAPETPVPPYAHSLSSPGPGGDPIDSGREKFIAKWDEIVRVEEKTLVVIGQKQLREDLDRRVGLIP